MEKYRPLPCGHLYVWNVAVGCIACPLKLRLHWTTVVQLHNTTDSANILQQIQGVRVCERYKKLS